MKPLMSHSMTRVTMYDQHLAKGDQHLAKVLRQRHRPQIAQLVHDLDLGQGGDGGPLPAGWKDAFAQT